MYFNTKMTSLGNCFNPISRYCSKARHVSTSLYFKSRLFNPLTSFTKYFILDVWQGSECAYAKLAGTENDTYIILEPETKDNKRSTVMSHNFINVPMATSYNGIFDFSSFSSFGRS